MEEIVKNEFVFYAKLARPLVLNLPKSKDRILAAAWIKKFGDENSGEEKLRITYLKLLLFCLQRRALSGIFADDPSFYPTLEQLPDDINLNEFARNLLEQEKVERQEKIRLEMMGDMEAFPVFTTDCSPDLTEYVAAQDIPNFGVHAYYAISKQPINKWQRSEFAIFPKGTKSAIDTSMTSKAQAATCPCAPKGSSSAPEVEEGEEAAEADEPACKKKKDKTPDKPKKRRPKKLGTSPPTNPIGEVKKPSEELPTPTWGTNLVEIRDRTDIGHIEEPSDAARALDKEVSQMMEEQEREEEENAANEANATKNKSDSLPAKAKGMLTILDEYKSGKMNKPKKPPSRLQKLGDRTGIKAKSTREPKIAVKGMKKGAKKGKGFGPKPKDLPEEFQCWTEKDLEEAGLTWADLMPFDDNIDDELQRIEDEGMATSGEDEELQIEEFQFNFGMDDLDAMIREAEADLDRSVYDEGVQEDESIVERFDDEDEVFMDEMNASRVGQAIRATSPAISSGIPVTTPQASPSPKRSRSPERVFAEEDDYLLAHRESPFQPPKRRQKPDKLPKRPKKPTSPTDKDPSISKAFGKLQKSVKVRLPNEELEEFEQLEKQLQEEMGEEGCGEQGPCGGGFSPGEADRVRQRARQQEAMLNSPGPSPCMAVSPHQEQAELDEFEQLERQYQSEIGDNVCGGGGAQRTPSPGRYSRDMEMVQERARQQEAMLRTPEQHGSPCRGASPMQEQAELDEFEQLERQYQAEMGGAQRTPSPGRYSPQGMEIVQERIREQEQMLRTPEDQWQFDGAADSQMIADEDLEELAGQDSLEYSFHRSVIEEENAPWQESPYRQGSPEANQIIDEAETSFRVGGSQWLERTSGQPLQLQEGGPCGEGAVQRTATPRQRPTAVVLPNRLAQAAQDTTGGSGRKRWGGGPSVRQQVPQQAVRPQQAGAPCGGGAMRRPPSNKPVCAVAPSTSAQRIADARRQYQQSTRGGPRRSWGAPAPAPYVQPDTPPPPPPAPFTAFVPPQVRARWAASDQPLPCGQIPNDQGMRAVRRQPQTNPRDPRMKGVNMRRRDSSQGGCGGSGRPCGGGY